jgi:hypothetical protein
VVGTRTYEVDGEPATYTDEIGPHHVECDLKTATG